MTFLQSLGLSKQSPQTNPNTQQKPHSSHQVKTNSPVTNSTEVNSQNFDMIQAWANGGSVSVLPTKARVLPKNAGERLDFLS